MFVDMNLVISLLVVISVEVVRSTPVGLNSVSTIVGQSNSENSTVTDTSSELSVTNDITQSTLEYSTTEITGTTESTTSEISSQSTTTELTEEPLTSEITKYTLHPGHTITQLSSHTTEENSIPNNTAKSTSELPVPQISGQSIRYNIVGQSFPQENIQDLLDSINIKEGNESDIAETTFTDNMGETTTPLTEETTTPRTEGTTTPESIDTRKLNEQIENLKRMRNRLPENIRKVVDVIIDDPSKAEEGMKNITVLATAMPTDKTTVVPFPIQTLTDILAIIVNLVINISSTIINSLLTVGASIIGAVVGIGTTIGNFVSDVANTVWEGAKHFGSYLVFW